MTRYKIQAIATLAFTLLTVPAFAEGSFLNPNMKSVVDPNVPNLPAVQNSTIDLPAVQNGPIDLPAVQNSTIDLPAVQNDPIEMQIELNH